MLTIITSINQARNLVLHFANIMSGCFCPGCVLGQGEPLLLIPGFSATMYVWDPVMLDKLSSNHTIIVFDNRGILQ